MGGKEILAAYLHVNEDYFNRQFERSDREMTQELANIIEGKLVEGYKIKGKRKLKYSQMKEELLNWYRKQRIVGKASWRKEFEKTAPGREEAYDMYGLRLIKLAKLAFSRVRGGMCSSVKTPIYVGNRCHYCAKNF